MRHRLGEGPVGVTGVRGMNGAEETMGVAAEYVTEHTVDKEDIVTTSLHNGDGKLHRGTGTEGENSEKEKKKP